MTLGHLVTVSCSGTAELPVAEENAGPAFQGCEEGTNRRPCLLPLDTQKLWTDLCGQRHVPAWREVSEPPWKDLNVQWPARDEWCPCDGFWFLWSHLNQCLHAPELEPASQPASLSLWDASGSWRTGLPKLVPDTRMQKIGDCFLCKMKKRCIFLGDVLPCCCFVCEMSPK